jgi:hypothetical protein
MAQPKAYVLATLATMLILGCGGSGDPTSSESDCSDTLQLRGVDGQLFELLPPEYSLVENEAGYYLTLQNTEKLQRLRELKVADFILCVQGERYLAKARRAFSATLPKGADFDFGTYPNGTMSFSSEGTILVARIESVAGDQAPRRATMTRDST